MKLIIMDSNRTLQKSSKLGDNGINYTYIYIYSPSRKNKVPGTGHEFISRLKKY